MKIITRDNYSRDLFAEQVVAYVKNEFIGRQMVDQWNEKYWNEHSQYYLDLVGADYELYDGYAELL